MRINVYSQELTREVTITHKDGHFGVRFYLESPDALHDTPDDDDRSAITFWVPNDGTMLPSDLTRIFERAMELCSEIRTVQIHQPRGRVVAVENDMEAMTPISAEKVMKPRR